MHPNDPEEQAMRPNRPKDQPSMPSEAFARRDEILDVAVKLFSQNGYRATRLSDVADTLGFTRAALYYYFRSKSEILIALIDGAGKQLIAGLQEALREKNVDPVEKLRRVLHNHALQYIRQPQLFTVFRAEVAELPKAMRRDLIQGERDYIRAVAALIEEAMTAKRFKARPAVPTTLAIISMANSVATWYRSKGGLSPQETADLVVSLCLEGLLER
ncbi:MAG: TetR/AcrR family transcriptional regulator [Alphaproteobacteria bacterium]